MSKPSKEALGTLSRYELTMKNWLLSHRKAIDIAAAVLTFITVWVMSTRCPLISDDFHYFFGVHLPYTEDGRVSSISELVFSVSEYYKYLGGRALCHLMLFLVLMAGKWVFDLVNAGIFVLFGVLVNKIAKKKTIMENSLPLLPLVYLICFITLPSFGDSCLWISGAVNYLWPAVAFLICIQLIDRYFEEPGLKRAAAIVFPLFVSSLTNENTGGMLGLYILFSLYRSVCGGTKEEKISLKKHLPLLIPIAFIAAGMAAVILAPGNMNRGKIMFNTKIFSPTTEEFVTSMYRFIIKFFVIIFIGELDVIVLNSRKETKGRRLPELLFHSRFITIGFIGGLVLCLSGFPYDDRAYFISDALALTGSIKILLISPKILFRNKLPVKKLVITSIFMIWLFMYLTFAMENGVLPDPIVNLLYIAISGFKAVAVILIAGIPGMLVFYDKLTETFSIFKSGSIADRFAGKVNRSASAAGKALTSGVLITIVTAVLLTSVFTYQFVLYTSNTAWTTEAYQSMQTKLANNDPDWRNVGTRPQNLSIFFPHEAQGTYPPNNYSAFWIAAYNNRPEIAEKV